MAINLKEKIQIANAIKNQTVYAPYGITYSTFFNPALENILLDVADTQRISLLEKQNAAPSFAFNLALKKRPSAQLAFDSFQEAGAHLMSPLFMPVFSAIEAAKALLNALILMPYYFVMGIAHGLKKDYAGAHEDFLNTFVYIPFSVAFWTFSALIDPCLELVSWLSRAAATMMYGWGGNKDVEKQKEYDALKKITVDQIKTALEAYPDAIQEVAAALSAMKEAITAFKMFLDNTPTIIDIFKGTITPYLDKLNKIEQLTYTNQRQAKKELQDLLKNDILPPLIATIKGPFGNTLIPWMQSLTNMLPLVGRIPELAPFSTSAARYIQQLQDMITTAGGADAAPELQNILVAMQDAKSTFDSTLTALQPLLDLLTLLKESADYSETPEEVLARIEGAYDLPTLLSSLVALPALSDRLQKTGIPFAQFTLYKVTELLDMIGPAGVKTFSQFLGKTEVQLDELSRAFDPTFAPK